MSGQALWINGGFIALRKEFFSYIEEGEELVEKPFSRLIAQKRLITFPWDGFWQCMDTFKDKERLENLDQCGAPWKLWTQNDAPCGSKNVT